MPIHEPILSTSEMGSVFFISFILINMSHYNTCLAHADGCLWCAPQLFYVLLVCPVFSYIPAISFTRDELLDIRQYTPPNI